MNLDRVIAVRTAKTVFRDGERCIKVFNEGHSKAAVLNEALNQARIEETGLKIPGIIEVTMLDSKWAIVSEYIKGKTLSHLMRENPEKRQEYLELFVSLQLEVHSKACPLLGHLKDSLRRKIIAAELDATSRYDLYNRLEDMPRHNRVCHGDFIPANIIITDDGTPYIIDWAHATQGNASADAAQTYLSFILNGDEETAKDYLALFCEKSRTHDDYVRKWIPIAAAARSVAANEKERAFLLSLVNSEDQI